MTSFKLIIQRHTTSLTPRVHIFFLGSPCLIFIINSHGANRLQTSTRYIDPCPIECFTTLLSRGSNRAMKENGQKCAGRQKVCFPHRGDASACEEKQAEWPVVSAAPPPWCDWVVATGDNNFTAAGPVPSFKRHWRAGGGTEEEERGIHGHYNLRRGDKKNKKRETGGGGEKYFPLNNIAHISLLFKLQGAQLFPSDSSDKLWLMK